MAGFPSDPDWCIRYRQAMERRILTNNDVDELRSQLRLEQQIDVDCLRKRRQFNHKDESARLDKLHPFARNGADPLLWNAKACSCRACWPNSYYSAVKQGMLFLTKSKPATESDFKSRQQHFKDGGKHTHPLLREPVVNLDLRASLSILPAIKPHPKQPEENQGSMSEHQSAVQTTVASDAQSDATTTASPQQV